MRGIETELGDIHERNTRNDEPLTIEDKRRDIDRANSLGKRARDLSDNLSADLKQDQNAKPEEGVQADTLPTEAVPSIAFSTTPAN
ncbi:MAG: hypothetical protein AAGJ35_11515 [Myxococcota bacterium]